jgi:Protein of unknown function (DUF3047)
MSGCALVAPAQDSNQVVSNNILDTPDAEGSIEVLSTSDKASLGKSQWKEENFPLKQKTIYTSVKYQGQPAIKAVARSSASAYSRKTNLKISAKTSLRWSWQVDSLITGADNQRRETEDSPARIVLSFEGDTTTLPLKDQLFVERASLVLGRPWPYATLMYIVANTAEVDSVITNPNTGRVRKIVVAAGESCTKKWQAFERNVYEDFKKAYGVSPGKLIGVSIFTDTDNTGEEAVAYYGAIQLKGLEKP